MSGRKIESKLIGHIFLPGIFLLPLTVLGIRYDRARGSRLEASFQIPRRMRENVANLRLREYNAGV